MQLENLVMNLKEQNVLWNSGDWLHTHTHACIYCFLMVNRTYLVKKMQMSQKFINKVKVEALDHPRLSSVLQPWSPGRCHVRPSSFVSVVCKRGMCSLKWKCIVYTVQVWKLVCCC